MIKEYLEAGKIVGTHGIKGEMRVECWCDSPSFFSQFKTLYLENGSVKLSVSCRAHKNIALIKVKGVDTIELADTYRGKIIYIKRSDVKLEEGVNFVQDIIGLSVTDADSGIVYGKITDVLKTGSNDVYEMKNADGELYYIPAIDEIIVSCDVENEVLLIHPMKGLFDNES